ncbi:hypothetical protein [Rhodohalobacter sp. SW132]|uniref:hypothetical protein n=1 Tax=Rhodohalobacter sp. SW132 TaxID=2293433 RepID=UPI001315ABC6|nr:hypothetical protein [Rhodohalobacter sp. SW132]
MPCFPFLKNRLSEQPAGITLLTSAGILNFKSKLLPLTILWERSLFTGSLFDSSENI